MAHELSRLILLGEGRINENDEELTDLNCLVLGFGIFIGNSIFNFSQWHGMNHQGWSFNTAGYIPEQVATYTMALFHSYQDNQTNWYKHLKKSFRKGFERNLRYLKKTTDSISFLAS